MSILRTLLAVGAITLLAVVPSNAAARKIWASWGTFVRSAKIENSDQTASARLTQILLPASFRVRQRPGYLTFGPVGACRSTGSVRVVLVRSQADIRGVLDAQVPRSTTVYGSGSRGDAVWRIVNAGTAALRGAYVRPTRIPDTWVVVRVGTTPHRTCHAGGYRESVAFPLADALATTKASGY